MAATKQDKTIGVLVGSLRRDSFSQKVARYLGTVLAEQFQVTFVDISDLPIYNEDLDNGESVPASWQRLREQIKAFDGVLFVTPEYNRSVPAVLKNALDVASRPGGANQWSGKPGAVVSVSPGSIGGFGANHHLRQSATCVNLLMMQQPEAYVGGIARAVNADGVADQSVQGYLASFAKAFTDWVNCLTP